MYSKFKRDRRSVTGSFRHRRTITFRLWYYLFIISNKRKKDIFKQSNCYIWWEFMRSVEEKMKQFVDKVLGDCPRFYLYCPVIYFLFIYLCFKSKCMIFRPVKSWFVMFRMMERAINMYFFFFCKFHSCVTKIIATINASKNENEFHFR